MFSRDPRVAIGGLEPLQRAGFDLCAVARSLRSEIPPSLHTNRVYEVFVQVVDELAGAVFQRAAHGDVVEDRQVLDVLAEPDAAGVRAHRDAELRRQQKYGQDLVDATEPAAVDLAEVDRLGLHELLEHHAVLHVLARCDADWLDRFADAAVAKHVIRAGGLLDPPRVDLGQHLDRADRLVDAPDLVGVEHQLALGTDRLAAQAGAARGGLP